MVNLFWRAIPKLKVKGNSAFARQNGETRFELRLELEQSPTHPLIGSPHWTIYVHKKRDRYYKSSSIYWHNKGVIVDLKEIFDKDASVLDPLRYVPRSAKPAIGGSGLGDQVSTYLSEHFDQVSLLNMELTLRELNLDYLLREINKLLPNTVFYSDFSTAFDYYSTLTRQIVTTGPGVNPTSDLKRVKNSSIFETFDQPEQTEPRPEKEFKENKLKKREYGNIEAVLPNPLPSKEVLDPDKKPKHSPDINKWYKKGGRIEIVEGGNWKYIDWEGNEVTYYGDFPDFDSYVRQQVEIEGMEGNYTTDYYKADEKATQRRLEENTWHHHQDLKTMQEIPRKIHERFTHYGASSIIKQNKKQQDKTTPEPVKIKGKKKKAN